MAFCHADDRLDALRHVVGVVLTAPSSWRMLFFQVIGDELGHVLGQIQVEQLGLALDDGHAGLKIRRLDIGGQAPLKAGAQTLFQALDLLGRAIRGDDDLFVGIVQELNVMEELFLGGLAGDELDIVHQQQGRPRGYFIRKSSVLRGWRRSARW